MTLFVTQLTVAFDHCQMTGLDTQLLTAPRVKT